MDDTFFDEEDLVVASTSNRNWKGIIIAVLVIASILSLIVTAVVLLTPPDEGPRVKGRRFELDDVFGQKFQYMRSNGSWISDHEWAFRDQFGGASILNVLNTTTHSFIKPTIFGEVNGITFTLSADKKYALLVSDIVKTHRYSFKARYTIHDISVGTSYPLTISENVGFAGNGAKSSVEFQLVKWAPTGNSLVLIHDNDIHYKSSASEKTTHRLTESGKSGGGAIYNGIPDWIYEEEILESNSALWFSADGQRLLYLTFNDSLVEQHHVLQYSNPDPNSKEEYTYPKVRTVRYPKPGTNNPYVTISVCDLRSGNRFYQKQFRPPEEISTNEHYISSAGWISATDVGVIWTTRSYHLAIISICSVLSGSCQEEFSITASEKKGWVGNIPFPTFTTWANSTNFITTAPIRDGEKGFFDHLVLVDTANKRSHPITHGSYDVIKINAWDEGQKLVYFIATPANHPNERHLYSVKLDQPYTDHPADCISCTFVPLLTLSNNGSSTPLPPQEGQTFYSPDLSAQSARPTGKRANQTKARQKEDAKEKAAKEKDVPEKVNPPFSTMTVSSASGRNSTCTFVTNVRFSPDYKFFMLECGGPNIPYEASYSMADYPNSDVRLLQIIQANDVVANLSKDMAFPQIRIFPVHLHSGVHAQVRLLLPPGLREDEITQYPMILNVYGAPGSQLATDRWGVDFATYLASKKDYIVAQIDGRGSGGRGWDFKHQVYYNLGTLETQDQIEVVRHLRDSLPYVETNKIGIWGWSYGGYLTASIMTNRDKIDLFQCGASIAPIAKWSLHDSAYSERFMGTPNVTDNYKGYAHSDLTRNIEGLAKKAFFLIHGTADENVHIQHSMVLAKALIDSKILFRQQIYPDEPHSLSGAKIHVHRSLEDFFEDCFKKQITPEVETGLNKGGKFDDFD